MLSPASMLLGILVITMGLFIWGRWRYDIVAAIALVCCVVLGLVPVESAFLGFANPAVVTVVAIMILTRTISDTGIVELLAKQLTPITRRPTIHVGVLALITAFLSAFMNNIGALGLMMPVAIRTAAESQRSPSKVLMPLAFASSMGGMVTAIGTPPNMIIAAFRQEAFGAPFKLFDFTPVGLVLAFVGVAYVAVLGWRLMPSRESKRVALEEIFQLHDYITEVKLTEKSKAIGQSLQEWFADNEFESTCLGVIRQGRKSLMTPRDFVLAAEDILIIQATHQELEKFIAATQAELVEEKASFEWLRSQEIRILEVVVPPGSRATGRTAASMQINTRYRVNLLAIAREGQPFHQRLNRVTLNAGDVLLLQGEAGDIQELVNRMNWLPLLDRDIKISSGKKLWLPLGIFIGAIVLAGLKFLPIHIAFVAAIIMMLLADIIPLRTLYDNIDWSIVVLLAMMIPIGMAMQTTGGTLLLTRYILELTTHFSIYGILTCLLIVTMTLSDFMNNAATAVVMAPIAVSTAHALGMNIDPFLMTVAIGASCSFLTPIGHQNNTLVMGPGGYHFGDYLRMGIWLEVCVIICAIPLILWFWPVK